MDLRLINTPFSISLPTDRTLSLNFDRKMLIELFRRTAATYFLPALIAFAYDRRDKTHSIIVQIRASTVVFI